MSSAIPAVVLGGTGYVAGELLRLLSAHPSLRITAVVSESQAGSEIAAVFPNLQDRYAGLCFVSRDSLANQLPETGPVAVFSAAPHGASAAMVQDVLGMLGHCTPTVVDVSADFRFSDSASYANVYSQPHGAPELLDSFTCALPEHLADIESPHVAHPGCFATAMLLGIVPLVSSGEIDSVITAVGVTGSTGSGRSPGSTTHHPWRHANMFAYKPLAHRHAPEVTAICTSVCGREPELAFMPHSGPFARGIHMTLSFQSKQSLDDATWKAMIQDFYQQAQFVRLVDGMPRIKDVTGSNYAHLGVAASGRNVAVMVAIDNLIKGASGGAIQWMNRKLGLPEETGLVLPGPAWI